MACLAIYEHSTCELTFQVAFGLSPSVFDCFSEEGHSCSTLATFEDSCLVAQ